MTVVGTNINVYPLPTSNWQLLLFSLLITSPTLLHKLSFPLLYNSTVTSLSLSWITISCYFIGELPIGSGIFNINNIAGMMLIPVNRTLHIVILLLTLQVCVILVL